MRDRSIVTWVSSPRTLRLVMMPVTSWLFCLQPAAQAAMATKPSPTIAKRMLRGYRNLGYPARVQNLLRAVLFTAASAALSDCGDSSSDNTGVRGNIVLIDTPDNGMTTV